MTYSPQANPPRKECCPTVFISYCREDNAQVDRLIADLTTAGLNCWIDTSSIKGGEEWVIAIADGIIKYSGRYGSIALSQMGETGNHLRRKISKADHSLGAGKRASAKKNRFW